MALGRSTTSALSLALAAGLVLTAAASGAAARASGTLALSATFSTTYERSPRHCPPETPPDVEECRRYVGAAAVRGLGRATEAYTKVIGDQRACPPESPVAAPRSAVIEVVGKGRIELSLPGPICRPRGPGRVGPLNATISGGSGSYAGASGSLAFESNVGLGPSQDKWTGSLTVPGLDFDLVPPVLRGARSRTMRAPRNAKRIRVVYAVTARDAVDGVVPAACNPRSGSRFRLGRTVVRCSATDSSANSTTKRFAITVERARRRGLS
jgi:hypothetical protein